MPHPMRAKFGLSLSTRAVLFGWATLDDLLNAAQTAEAVIEKIQAYLEAGCTTPVLRFVAPNLGEQLQRCMSEVLPAFRAA